MVTSTQLASVFAPLRGTHSPCVVASLSGNINTILKVAIGSRLYGLRIRVREGIFRYEPDIIKEPFVSWLLHPSNWGTTDVNKAAKLSNWHASEGGTGPASSGIEPTSLIFDWSRKILPHPYLIYHWVEGTTLWDNPTADIYHAAGKALHSLHKTRFEAFYANLLDLATKPLDWSNHFQSALDKETLEARTWLRPDLRAALATMPRPDPPLFPPCLVHNDFAPGNIIVDKGRLSAVIDWDNAVVDVAPLDFIKMKYWTYKGADGLLNADIKRFNAFVSGYGEDGAKIVESATFNWYELLWLLRVSNFEIAKQRRGLGPAPGYPPAQAYGSLLETVIRQVQRKTG